MTGREYHPTSSSLLLSGIAMLDLTDASSLQAEKEERVSARVEPSVTERSFVITSKA